VAPPLLRPGFTIVLRDHERRQVDRFVEQARARIAQLEREVARLSAPSDRPAG
jgi:hypothetical protein